MTASLRLLLIEDVEDDARLIVRLLQRAGYDPIYERVDTAAAVSAALDRGPWDIVISDFNMPRFSGTAALQLLRSRDPDTPLIFVSGEMGEDVAVEAMRTGAQDYVTKGNLGRLVPAIERELRDRVVRRERKRAEEALARSQATYRSLVEDSPFGIFESALDGRLIAVNPGLVSILGYASEAELLHTNLATDVYVDPSERARLVEAALKSGTLAAESQWRRKDGTTITVRQTGRVVRDAQGRVEYFNVIVEDVTERQLLEAQLRQAQKMESVGRLAGGVAHDFNNVLTAIFGYADLVLEDLPPDSAARQDIEEIRKAAERAAALTRQLLAFSRQQVLAPVVLRVNDLVEDIAKMLLRLVGEDIAVRLALARDVGNVRADPGQLQQVLMNLVVNARDAMPTGGKLLIETANAALTEQYAELHQPVVPGAYMMLAVSDTGIGMDAETKARIFEPFFTTKEKGRGTGLGLSTVYGIVKQSGGYIWVYSEPGRGTTFKLYFPRVVEPAEALPPPKEMATLSGTETILLAEDDEMLRPLSKGLLEKLGYRVLEAENVERALAVASAYAGPIHLLVSDVVMPGASGRELARRLAPTRPDTRVLFVSGYTDDAVVHHGMLEPGLTFLQKPFTPAALARKVREVLDTT
jgi:two-component system cell cycle sensor histidine kinase/response regulator CckA